MFIIISNTGIIIILLVMALLKVAKKPNGIFMWFCIIAITQNNFKQSLIWSLVEVQ